MIYTVTFNPSIDYYVTLDELKTGGLNRATATDLRPGGKGINVSMMLEHMGLNSIALGFVGGFTGTELIRLLEDARIRSDLVQTDAGCTRINVKVRESDGRETEINGPGPKVGRKELSELYGRLGNIRAGDILVLSGAVSPGMSDTSYADILEYMTDRDIDVIVDAAGPLLRQSLAGRPFLIKPNRQELEELFSTGIETNEDIMKYAVSLQKAGARNVLVSLGGDGAALLTEDGRQYICEAPRGDVSGTVGAGDAMIAGYIYGYVEREDTPEYALRMGVAAGSATAFAGTFAKRSDVLALLGSM